MNFDDLFIFRKERFSIGQETENQTYYLSIPVNNGMVEYEEYYEISKEEFERFSASLEQMRQVATMCRERRNDDKLIMKPGRLRGTPT